MTLYQRKQLPSTNMGGPGPLPAFLVGLSDAVLANLPANLDAGALEQLGLQGQGFFPVADPPAPPSMVVSPYDFLLLFTADERVAIRTAAASNAAIADWLDLLNHVTAVHLDAPNAIAGVGALAAATLITSDRAAEILSNTPPE